MCSFLNENLCRITYDLVRKAQGSEPYPMSLTGEAVRAVERVVNIGIDSHLEACFIRERGDSYEPGKRMVGDKVITTTLECKVSPESLPVLLRRLYEDLPDGPLADVGSSLASDILQTLGIGEDGALKRRDEE